MASEQATREQDASQHTSSAPPRPLSARRKKKLLIVVIVVAIALVVIIWGWSSTGGSFIEVSSVVDASTASVPDKYLGKIDIRGVVSEWSGGSDLDFKLVDTADPSKSLGVTMTGTLPEGFENGKTVVANGYLNESLPLHLTATEITVGCASKY
jgi:cytochrome c-type biogenesis protein CcmE